MGAGLGTVVALVLSITPNSGGSVSAPRITINAGVGNQFDPHVDQQLAAYSNAVVTASGDIQEIRYYDFPGAKDLAISNLLTDGSRANDLLSDIDQGRVVFTRIFPGRNAIMLFDAASSVVSELAPAPNSNRMGVAIGAGTVAFIDYGLDATGDGEVMALDLSTGLVARLTNDSVFDGNPAVSPDGNVITWERCATFANCDIVRAVRSGGAWTTAPMTSNLLNERNPDTNGSQVVLERYNPAGPTGSDLVLVPVAGGAETVIELPGEQYNPSIRGQLVAFEGRASVAAASDIFLVDLPTNRVFQVTDTPGYSESLNDVTVLPTGEVRLVWQANDDPNDPSVGNIYGTTFSLPTVPPPPTGGGAGGGTGGGTGGGGGTVCQNRSVTLEADRVYSPTKATDGVATFSAPFGFEIPASVPVTDGNAGNKKVVLTIALGGKTLRCQYRGGSPKAHPSAAADVTAGLSYQFVSCYEETANDDAAEDHLATAPSYGPGTVVSAMSVKLHVQGGDSWYPRTAVRLSVAESCLGQVSSALDAQGNALAPDGLGCSSTAATVVPMAVALALLALAWRRPASIRVVERRERRRLSR